MIERSTLTTLAYNADLCSGCGTCVTVCPHAVFEVAEGKARLARPDACMECGACRLNCPRGAIEVDSGVGCAAAMIYAAIMRRKEVTCGPSDAPCCGSASQAPSSPCCSQDSAARPDPKKPSCCA